jgi:hypothetical protein
VRPFVLLIAGLILLGGVPSLPWPVVPVVVAPAKANRAVYVYEKDATPVPTGVTVALDALNRRGIVANLYEADTTDGDGDVPTQFAAALEAAKASGLPALVVLSGSSVLRVVPAPATDAAVLEAVQ